MRKNNLSHLLDPLYQYIEELLSAVADGGYETHGSKPAESSRKLSGMCRNLRKDCLRLQAGSLIAGLRALALWPRKDVAEIMTSPKNLAEMLLGIKVSHCYDNGFSRRALLNPGITCGSFSTTVDKDFKSTRHKTHLETQRQIWDRTYRTASRHEPAAEV